MSNNTNKIVNKLTLLNGHYQHRKYKILEIIDQMPTNKNKQYKKEIPRILNITRQTWSVWLNTSIADTLEIPSIKLAQIAKLLNTTTEQLINIEIKMPQIQTEEQKFQNQLLKDTKLVK